MPSRAEKRKNTIVKNARKSKTEADTQIALADDANTQKLRTQLGKLSKYYEEFCESSVDTLAEITDEADYDAALETDSEIQDELLEFISEIQTFLETFMGNGAGAKSMVASTNPSLKSQDPPEKLSVQLPKLQIAYYDGDPLKWLEFWDSYNSTIHERSDLVGVEKFKYLQSFLKGDAKRFLAGYPLSNDSYETAVDALTKRFGDKEVIIQAHLHQFLALPVAGREVHELRKTYDECERHIRSLVALDLKEDQFGRIFTPLMQSKFPYFLQVDLNRGKGEGAWTLEKLRSQLSTEISAREGGLRGFGQPAGGKSNTQSQPKGTNGHNHNGHSHFKTPQKTVSAFPVGQSKERKCVYCSGKHFHDECNVVPDVASRKALLTDRCFKCLSLKHKAKECDQSRVCRHCDRYGHHRSLCTQKFQAEPEKRIQTKSLFNVHAACFEPNAGTEEGNKSVSLFSHSNGGNVGYLHTALAQISGSRANTQTRLLLDNGSTVTFITTRLAKKIGAKFIRSESMSVAGFQTEYPHTHEYQVYSFTLFLLNGSQMEIQAYATKAISSPILRYAHDLDANPVLQQVRLADTLCPENESVELKMLIGGDYYYDIVCDGHIKGSDGLVLLNTKLGYVVAGKTPKAMTVKAAGCMFTQGNPVQISDDLHKLWRLEDIGIKEPEASTDDELAVAKFNESITFDKSEKRYMVNWPWNSNKNMLPDNFGKAYGRLTSLVKQLRKQPEVFQTYTQTINTQIEKGIIEPAPKNPEGQVHYLPHHAVITPERETTKLRVVYDGSCKPSKHEVSLNECLLQGPVLVEDIGGLLMRFRLHKVGILADIEKAFLQIGLHKDQRDVTRFLWLKDLEKPPTIENLAHFRFSRVCFGMNSSPFLLAATIQHISRNANTPIAAQIAENIYVDNMIISTPQVVKAQKIYSEAKTMFESASMNLREWYSNSSALIESLPECDRGKAKNPKVLGINWDVAMDALSCPKFKSPPDQMVSKRAILKAVAQAYDPCGFFAPVTVRGKMLLQQLWKQKVSWDEMLDSKLCQKARDIVSDIQNISKFQIPRCIAIEQHDPADVQFQLHCFADASAAAFSVAVYLRQQSSDQIKVDLIFGKSRVAPLKEHTIPRLELLAATLASRLAVYTREQLQLLISQTVVWSDSQCVLHWILGKPVTTVFVRNRVNEIRAKSDLKWRYVPTHENPADIPSRGTTFNDIIRSKLWWKGPKWLSEDETSWPSNISVPQVAEVQIEPEPIQSVVMAASKVQETQFEIHRYSTLTKAVGVMSKVLRVIHRMLKAAVLTDQQYRELALIQLLKQGQSRHKKCPNYNATVKQLRVYQDADGLVRCRGRVTSEVAMRNPILLPRTDSLTNLLIEHVHNKLQHAGVDHVLAEIRYEYWIPQARRAIKSVSHKCTICRRHRGPPYRIPEAPPLPEFRTQVDRPFACIGLDYLGPLHIKTATDTQKVWICILTCAVTRAIHLEVVENMNTNEFILALRRFMAFYGTPRLILSDQAQQFHMADRLYKRLVLENDEVQEFVRKNAMQWKFIVEMAPWMGGFYERLVGLVKKSLRAAIHTSKLSLTELQTVVYEACAVLNSRPLVYNEDEVGFHPITPSHLLMRHSSIYASLPAAQADAYYQQPKSSDHLVVTWKRLQHVLENFWNTWRKQYLITLRDSAWQHKQRNVSDQQPSVGDIVLIHEDKQPRGQWNVAKITQLIPSADGICRAAIVTLADKRSFRRPIKFLHPLEAVSEHSQSRLHSQNESEPNSRVAAREVRPKRIAAIDANWKVARNLSDESSHELI